MEYTDEEPTRRDHNSDTRIGARVQMKEGAASSVNFTDLRCRIVHQVLLIELVEAVIELEFRDHEKARVECKSFLSLSWGLVRLRIGLVFTVTARNRSLAASHLSEVIRDPAIKREAGDWDVLGWQNVKNIELVWHGAFLANWQDLEPAQSLRLFDHFNDIVPFLTGEWILKINFKALELSFDFLRLSLFLLLLLLFLSALRGARYHRVRFNSLSKRVVTVDDSILACLVVLLRANDKEFALDLGEGVRRHEVLAW